VLNVQKFEQNKMLFCFIKIEKYGAFSFFRFIYSVEFINYIIFDGMGFGIHVKGCFIALLVYSISEFQQDLLTRLHDLLNILIVASDDASGKDKHIILKSIRAIIKERSYMG